jgi:hypothetical protein
MKKGLSSIKHSIRTAVVPMSLGTGVHLVIIKSNKLKK